MPVAAIHEQKQALFPEHKIGLPKKICRAQFPATDTRPDEAGPEPPFG